jgi:uncharacterized protein YwqG
MYISARTAFYGLKIGFQDSRPVFAITYAVKISKNDYQNRAAKRRKIEAEDGGRSRSTSRAPRDQSGVRDPETRKKLKKMEKKMQSKTMNRCEQNLEFLITIHRPVFKARCVIFNFHAFQRVFVSLLCFVIHKSVS